VYSLESIDECIRLRNRIDTLGTQPRSARNKKSKAHNTIAIIGAGPTGVEAATEIFHILNADDNKESRSAITLIESAKRILPEWGEHLRARAESILDECDVEVLTRTNVDRIGKSSITLKGGKTVAAETVVWCGGLKGSPIYESIGASLDKSGRLRVNTLLQVPKLAHIYAMGDAINTDVFLDRVPQSAQAAYQQAKVIAHNIVNQIQRKPLKHFRYFELGEVMPIGGRRAIARMLGVPLSGSLAWTLEKGIYVFRVPGLANKMKLLNAVAIAPLEQRGEEYLEKRGW
jgi:NADH dehydrogenase